MRYAAFLSILLALALSTGCSGAGQQVPGSGDANQPAPGGLPHLAELDLLTADGSEPRMASAVDYQLLNWTPGAASPAGTAYITGQLSLDPPAAGGMCWAIFALGGFTPGGENIPQLVHFTIDAPVWCGLANYAGGSWQLSRIPTSRAVVLEPGADFISPGGYVYVAVIGYDFAASVSSLLLTTSLDLPGTPTAVLTVLSPAVEAYSVQFNAGDSLLGEGGTITEVVYDFGDLTAPESFTDPAQVVEHTYATPGDYTITLTVSNDLGFSDSSQTTVTVGSAFKELLVVYNSDIPESVDLAQYYASPASGRSIHPDYLLGLPRGRRTLSSLHASITKRPSVTRSRTISMRAVTRTASSTSCFAKECRTKSRE